MNEEINLGMEVIASSKKTSEEVKNLTLLALLDNDRQTYVGDKVSLINCSIKPTLFKITEPKSKRGLTFTVFYN